MGVAMRVADITLGQVARVCSSHHCEDGCPFHTGEHCLMNEGPLDDYLDDDINLEDEDESTEV